MRNSKIYIHIHMAKMKIFWTASFHGKAKYQSQYDLVGRVIGAQPNVEVIATEKGNYLSILPPAVAVKLQGSPQKLHYEAIRRGILWADAVIIEISEESFQLGHEATLAMQAKKHVLCISVNEDYSAKINNRYFHGFRYSKANIEEIIENFLTRARKELLSRRFNLFLSPSQTQYLTETASRENVSVAEIIRSLIDSSR